MPQAYRSTRHPATGAPPLYELLMNREVRTKLDHFPSKAPKYDSLIRPRDKAYKLRPIMKTYHDRRHRVRQHNHKPGDAVIVKRQRNKKGQTRYKSYSYIITSVRGSTIHAKRIEDGRTICRDASKVKKLNQTMHQTK